MGKLGKGLITISLSTVKMTEKYYTCFALCAVEFYFRRLCLNCAINCNFILLDNFYFVLSGFMGCDETRNMSCGDITIQQDVPPTLIQNITGHKNVQSISNYAKASRRQHYEMQKILTGRSSSTISASSNDSHIQVPPTTPNAKVAISESRSGAEAIEAAHLQHILQNNTHKEISAPYQYPAQASLSVHNTNSSILDLSNASLLYGDFS